MLKISRGPTHLTTTLTAIQDGLRSAMIFAILITTVFVLTLIFHFASPDFRLETPLALRLRQKRRIKGA